MELTEYGKYFLERSELIINEINKTIKEIKIRSHQIKAEINVGFTYGAISALNPDNILKFKKNNPDIILLISEYPDLICEQMLDDRIFDLAIVVSPVDNEKYECKTLLIETLYMLINTQNPLAYYDRPLSMEDLRLEKFLTVNDSFNAPISFEESCEKAGFKPNVVFTSPEAFLLQEMARQNKGIYIMPEHAVASVDYKDAIFRPFPDPELIWEICLITRKNESLSYPALDFYEYLLEITNK